MQYRVNRTGSREGGIFVCRSEGSASSVIYLQVEII